MTKTFGAIVNQAVELPAGSCSIKVKMFQKQSFPEPKKEKNIRLWFALFFAAGVVATLIGESFFTSSNGNNGPVGATGPGTIAGSSNARMTGAKGPWGNLEYTPILLEPDDLLQDGEKQPPAKWIFENVSRQQLTDLFNSCDFTSSQKAFFLDTGHWEILTNGIALLPSDELILSLGKTACQQIYPLLGKSTANGPQNFPFRFPPDKFDERFADVGFAPATLNLIRTQTYTNGGWICFSSLHPMERTFKPEEYHCLKRALYRVPTLRIRLHVNSDSDIPELVKYWGIGGRERIIRPLLESLAKTPGGESISVSAFFPPFARLRLYTYPDPNADAEVAKEDCFYTSLNFFNDRPDPKYLDHLHTKDVVMANYYQTKDELVFGDLMMFMDANGTAVHICVFVADDIAFTKNGVGYLEPWVMMRLNDILADYPSDPPLRMMHLRRKGL
ncbi:MAG: hypothetical protein JWR26_489 [Pedosphaera sp.]|nr:hypothetical protein [Pedosphaera sp.]